MGNPRSMIASLLVGAVITLAVFWSTSGGGYRPETYDGDRTETRTCKECNGSGGLHPVPDALPAPSVRCTFCGGAGTVSVLVPGPNRPTVIWGAVVDRDQIRGDEREFRPANIRPPQGVWRERNAVPIPAALPNAQVRFSASGHSATATTDAGGRFSLKLPPGEYEVEVDAAEYHPARLVKKLRIEPLREPIWYQDAPLQRAVAAAEGITSADESRGLYGLVFIGGLSKLHSSRCFWRVGLAEYY